MPAALQGSLVGRWYPEPLSSTKPLSPLALEIHANTKFSMAGVQVSEPCSRRAMGRDASTHEPTTSQGTLTNTKPTHQHQRQRRHQHRDGCRDPSRSSMSLNWRMESPLSRQFIIGLAVRSIFHLPARKVLSSYHPASSCQLVLSRLVSSRLILS